MVRVSLYEEPVNLIARAGHPMAGGNAAEAVRMFPLILPNAGAIIRQVVEEFLHSIGLHDSRPAFETVSLPFARGLLERSDMLWFISRGVVARELEDGSLVALDFGGRQMAGAVGLTHRTSRDQHPDIDDLIGLLHKSATKAG